MNQEFQAVSFMPMGLVWLFPLIYVVIIAFVLVISWRVMRALERMAACMESNAGPFGGPNDITTS